MGGASRPVTAGQSPNARPPPQHASLQFWGWWVRARSDISRLFGCTGVHANIGGYTRFKGGYTPPICPGGAPSNVTSARMPRVRVDGKRFVASHKAENWCITFIPASEDDLATIDDGLPRVNRKTRVRWLARGVESGPLFPSGWTREENFADAYGTANAEEQAELRRKTPHLQVAIQTDGPTTWGSVAAWAKGYLTSPGHVEPANGSLDDQRKYCSKEGVNYAEFGEPQPFDRARAARPGSRSDLTEVKAMIDEGKEWTEILEAHFSTVAMHEKFLLKYKGDRNERLVMEALTNEFNAITWRPWQQTVLSIAEGPVQNRKVHVVVDQAGNTGKSFLAKYLMIKYGALTLDAVSKRDMAYIFLQRIDSGHSVPIVCIDIARSIVGSGLQEHLPNTAMTAVYNFVESLHNGSIVNTKYESKIRIFMPPHVFIFTNHQIDINEYTLSRDRWHIMNLRAGILTDYNPHQWD